MRRVLALLLLALTGCGGTSAKRGHDKVAELVQARSGYKTRWEAGPPSDDRIARWVDELLAGGLTQDRAVEIALVNNRHLQMTYEELGISQAEMVQAGLLPNPTIAGSVGFPFHSGGSRPEYEASIAEDFLALFLLPLRKRIARQQFLSDTVRVAHETLHTVAEVKQELVTVQTTARLVELRRSIVEAADAAADLAQRQREAGNITDLALTREQGMAEQAQLDLTREELALVEAREELNRHLGLWGKQTAWSLAEALPELPAEEPPLEHLEARAIARRLDLEAARLDSELLWNALDLARTSRYFGVVEIGAHVHQDPDGPRLAGPTLSLELPIFDQRRALLSRLEAQHRQSVHRLDAMAIDTRSEVRVARARMMAKRAMVERMKTKVLPIRERAVEQAQLQYNAMQVGLFELIETRRAQIEAYRDYLEAVKDYWSARADLELATGGSLFRKETTTK